MGVCRFSVNMTALSTRIWLLRTLVKQKTCLPKSVCVCLVVCVYLCFYSYVWGMCMYMVNMCICMGYVHAYGVYVSVYIWGMCMHMVCVYVYRESMYMYMVRVCMVCACIWCVYV